MVTERASRLVGAEVDSVRSYSFDFGVLEPGLQLIITFFKLGSLDAPNKTRTDSDTISL
jgi:hypothetical protein